MTERDEPPTTSEPTDILDTETPMTQHPDPTSDPLAEPTPDPSTDPLGDPTTTIETVHTKAVPAQDVQSQDVQTQAVPEQIPFRVEPATPVPDDVTSDTASDLPHLPPPSVGPVAPPASTPRIPQSGGCDGGHPWDHASHRGHAHVTVHKGPRPGAVVLGLLAMLVSAYVIAVNVSDASLSFRLVGPVLIGALGGLLLLVGLAGVLIGRLRR
jgi:hypothetical protein